MEINVEMWAFQDGILREVDVPDEELTGCIEKDLELVFRYGQNEIQPQNKMCGVSVGDIIVMPVEEDLEYWKVEPVGFVKVARKEAIELVSNFLGLGE